MKEKATYWLRYAIDIFGIRNRKNLDMEKKSNSPSTDKVAAALEALLDTQPDAELSLLDQVATHFALIEKLRERGHSFGRIAEALQQVGVEIAENTLRLYVGRLRRKTSAPPKRAQVRLETAAPPAKARVRRQAPALNAAPAAGPEPSNKASEVATWLTEEPDESNI